MRSIRRIFLALLISLSITTAGCSFLTMKRYHPEGARYPECTKTRWAPILDLVVGFSTAGYGTIVFADEVDHGKEARAVVGTAVIIVGLAYLTSSVLGFTWAGECIDACQNYRKDSQAESLRFGHNPGEAFSDLRTTLHTN